MDQVTTITFFRYAGLEKVWALSMMQFAHRYLVKTSGLTFYKLLGTGKGDGFSPWPDYSSYALLQVWDNEQAADCFFQSNPLSLKYHRHSLERWTLYMRVVKADGQWSGENPFITHVSDNIGSVAIITRATIKASKLRTFWSYVPTSGKPLKRNEGLLYTKGIGEVPFLQMATFSLWKDEDSMKKFAYQSKEHGKAIALTKSLNWYKEELFARFYPYRSEGTWHGQAPLISENRLQ
ncbi:MAG: spheroidene monooxygenase [Ekhidna sp.]|nr:spheroidene monooxygenase [Ekhidna sp.]